MHFGQPVWLIIGAAAAGLLFYLYHRSDSQRRRLLASFSLPRSTDDPAVGVSRSRLWLKRASFAGVLLCLCVALARPLGGMHMQQVQRRGIDVLFAVDTSRSMLTPDVKPDRLTRAKMAVEDLLDKLDGDGVGLIAFAGDAFLQAPVTTDYGAFRDSLDALDTHTIPRGGTDIAAAIRLAQATVGARAGSDKILVLITDGEDLGGEAIAAAKSAAAQGLRIYTVGVGTASGELIPVPDGHGGTQFVRDPAGNFVKSRLDEAALRQIAQAGGGTYWPLGSQGQGIVSLYDKALSSFARHDLAERQIAVYSELFQWPLFLAVVLLVANWLVRLRARGQSTVATPVAGPPAAPAGRWRSSPATAALLLLGVVVGAAPVTSRASTTGAEQAYQHGNYALATQEYAASVKQQPTKAELEFNLGASEYKLGQFGRAATAFDGALKTQQIPLQQSAYFNLGNTQYREGEQTVRSAPQQTIATWKQALGAYDTALQLRPTDTDAKFNRDLVKRKLDELQRQQQQNKQNQKNQQQNQSQQSQKSGQQGQSSQSSGQQGQKSKSSQGSGSSSQSQQAGGGSQARAGKPSQQPQQGQQAQQSQTARQGQQPQQGQQAQQGQQPSQPGQQQGQQDSRQANEGAHPSDAHGKRDERRTPDNGGTGASGGQPTPQQANANGPNGTSIGSPTQPYGQQRRPADGTNVAANERPQPGQMTRSEAQQLLDSLKGDQRRLALAAPNGTQGDASEPLLRDW